MTCNNTEEVCTWFQIGFLPTLKYSKYQISVELLGADNQPPEDLWKDVKFRMVFINKNWTEAQFIVRGVFSCLSVIVFVIYSS